MIALSTIFVSSFILALSGAMMPGPLLTATISESARRGCRTGPLLIIGHGLLEIVLVIAIMLGLAPYLSRPEIFVIIAITGSAILFWMAYGMFRALPLLSMDFHEQAAGRSSLILEGILLSLANPYWTVWWLTIGLGYIIHCRTYGVAGISAFFAGHILADLAWYSAVSVAISKGRHLMNDGIYRGLIGSCGAILVVFGCYFAYAGISKVIA